MTATPFATRAMHLDDVSMSSFGTPFTAAAPASMDFLNAQLVAHGFTHGHGLNLSDLRGKDQGTVLKCLANMLGQRMEDMGRAEQLSAKYKTLSYDYERLIEQHAATKEVAARAEREMEVGKAKVESASKRLLSEEETHKKSKEDLQRVKMAMQYLRTTTSNELKRKEKEVEKMTERWAKISNDQVKLGTIGAGLACSNLLPEQAISEESNMWEAALADSEVARLKLLKENDAFRDVILGCANALQTLHTSTIATVTKVGVEEPELMLSDVLFASLTSKTQAETAQEKLRELFCELRDALAKFGSLDNSRSQSLRQREEDAEQIQTLQQENESLKTQLREAQATLHTQGQQLLDQFVTDARFMAGQRHVADLSVEMLASPNKGTIVEELEEQRKHLEADREKYTEATLKLGREKAVFEAERLQFLEDKRQHKLQTILDDLPPTPEPTVKHSSDSVSADSESTSLLTKMKRQTSQRETRPAVSVSIPASQPTTSTLPPAHIAPALPTAFASDVVPPKQAPKAVAAVSFALPTQRAALQASTTPPMPEDELSPTSPTDHLNPLRRSPPRQKQAIVTQPSVPSATALPPSFRTQKTPKRPTYSQTRAQHKYSPAVPSPLSRMISTRDSPPSSPESQAQKDRQRPPVIQEEDEDLVQSVRQEPAPELELENDALPPPDLRPGSLSPLSRIMNMGLSPAIAPTLAISSFPGLLGTGPLSSGLFPGPKPIAKGFGAMPGSLQLGTIIEAKPVARITKAAPKSGISKIIKSQAKPAPGAKPSRPKKEPVILAENRPRSSKESTSSDGSGSSGSDRKSSTSTTSGKRVTTIKTQGNQNAKQKVGIDKVKGKENVDKPSMQSKKAPTTTKLPGTVRQPMSSTGPTQAKKISASSGRKG